MFTQTLATPNTRPVDMFAAIFGEGRGTAGLHHASEYVDPRKFTIDETDVINSLRGLNEAYDDNDDDEIEIWNEELLGDMDNAGEAIYKIMANMQPGDQLTVSNECILTHMLQDGALSNGATDYASKRLTENPQQLRLKYDNVTTFYGSLNNYRNAIITMHN